MAQDHPHRDVVAPRFVSAGKNPLSHALGTFSNASSITTASDPDLVRRYILALPRRSIELIGCRTARVLGSAKSVVTENQYGSLAIRQTTLTTQMAFENSYNVTVSFTPAHNLDSPSQP